MVAELRLIDYYANAQSSHWHQASAPAKVFGTGVTVVAVILNDSLPMLLILMLLVAIAVLSARLPLMRLSRWLVYPLMFALVFAVSQFVGLYHGEIVEAVWFPLILLARAIAAAFVVLFLLCTTPQTEVFGLLGRVLPDLIVNVMFMTYRFFFMLIDEIEAARNSVHLKGGFGRAIRKNVNHLASIMGLILINSIDRSQRVYGIMVVRGFNGKLSTRTQGLSDLNRYDILPLGLAAASIVLLFLPNYVGGVW